MEKFKRTIIITGGAGFIGSHVVRLFVNKYPEYEIINLDKLTYAGNLANLKEHISTGISLIVIVGILTGCILASIYIPEKKNTEEVSE